MLPSSGDAPSQQRWQPDYFLLPRSQACDIISLLLFGVFGGLLPCVMFACFTLTLITAAETASIRLTSRFLVPSVRLTIILHDVSVALTLRADWSLRCAANLVAFPDCVA